MQAADEREMLELVRAMDGRNSAVAPGATYVYQWDVPARAGPGPNDPSYLFDRFVKLMDEAKR